MKIHEQNRNKIIEALSKKKLEKEKLVSRFGNMRAWFKVKTQQPLKTFLRAFITQLAIRYVLYLFV